MKKDNHANSTQNRIEVATLKKDKTDFKMKITRNKVGDYIMIIGSMNQDLTIRHIYVPNNRVLK